MYTVSINKFYGETKCWLINKSTDLNGVKLKVFGLIRELIGTEMYLQFVFDDLNVGKQRFFDRRN